MIMGVDHVALSCGDLDDACSELEAAGYTVRFREDKLLNHPSKRAYLGRYQSSHSIAYCASPASVAIELTSHGGSKRNASSAYSPLVARIPESSLRREEGRSPAEEGLKPIWRQAGISNGPAVAARWDRFHAPCWFDVSPVEGAHGVQAVQLYTQDLGASVRFWVDGLRAKVVMESGLRYAKATQAEWALLAFSSPIPTWSLQILLVETHEGELPSSLTDEPALDSEGFNCVALLSNRLADDLKSALDAGGQDPTEIFELTVNSKLLRVCLLRGPSREIVELISV